MPDAPVASTSSQPHTTPASVQRSSPVFDPGYADSSDLSDLSDVEGLSPSPAPLPPALNVRSSTRLALAASLHGSLSVKGTLVRNHAPLKQPRKMPRKAIARKVGKERGKKKTPSPELRPPSPTPLPRKSRKRSKTPPRLLLSKDEEDMPLASLVQGLVTSSHGAFVKEEELDDFPLSIDPAKLVKLHMFNPSTLPGARSEASSDSDPRDNPSSSIHPVSSSSLSPLIRQSPYATEAHQVPSSIHATDSPSVLYISHAYPFPITPSLVPPVKATATHVEPRFTRSQSSKSSASPSSHWAARPSPGPPGWRPSIPPAEPPVQLETAEAQYFASASSNVNTAPVVDYPFSSASPIPSSSGSTVYPPPGSLAMAPTSTIAFTGMPYGLPTGLPMSTALTQSIVNFLPSSALTPSMAWLPRMSWWPVPLIPAPETVPVAPPSVPAALPSRITPTTVSDNLARKRTEPDDNNLGDPSPAEKRKRSAATQGTGLNPMPSEGETFSLEAALASPSNALPVVAPAPSLRRSTEPKKPRRSKKSTVDQSSSKATSPSHDGPKRPPVSNKKRGSRPGKGRASDAVTALSAPEAAGPSRGGTSRGCSGHQRKLTAVATVLPSPESGLPATLPFSLPGNRVIDQDQSSLFVDPRAIEMAMEVAVSSDAGSSRAMGGWDKSMASGSDAQSPFSLPSTNLPEPAPVIRKRKPGPARPRVRKAKQIGTPIFEPDQILKLSDPSGTEPGLIFDVAKVEGKSYSQGPEDYSSNDSLQPFPRFSSTPLRSGSGKPRKSPSKKTHNDAPFTVDKSSWVLPVPLSLVKLERPVVFDTKEEGRKKSGQLRGKKENHWNPHGRTVQKGEAIVLNEGERLIEELPPVWSLGRQELCEGLPHYFQSYQGGHYDKNGRCFGYLLDGFGSKLDSCTDHGRVIISHGGGCSESPASSGGASYSLKTSQLRTSTRVKALINCMETETPVVLIAGRDYPFFPWLRENGVRYAVLGHYFATHVWAEAEPNIVKDRKVKEQSQAEAAPAEPEAPSFHVRFKVRFEWCPSQGEPWFFGCINTKTTSESLKSASGFSLFGSDGETAAPLSPTHRVDSPPPLSSHFAFRADWTSDVVAEAIENLLSLEAPVTSSTSALPFTSNFDRTTPVGPEALPVSSRASEGACAKCSGIFTQIYIENVSCYNEMCDDFFKVNGQVATAWSLHVQPYLLLVTPDPVWGPEMPFQLLPSAIQDVSSAISQLPQSQEAGIHSASDFGDSGSDMDISLPSTSALDAVDLHSSKTEILSCDLLIIEPVVAGVLSPNESDLPDMDISAPSTSVSAMNAENYSSFQLWSSQLLASRQPNLLRPSSSVSAGPASPIANTDDLTSLGASSTPSTLLVLSQDLPGASVNLDTESWRAYHCRVCGRLSSRKLWNELRCSCCSATADACPTRRLAPPPVSASVRGPLPITPYVTTVISRAGFTGYTIHLGEDARVHHVWRETTAMADVLFQSYQAAEATSHLSRNPLLSSRLPGAYHCSNFSFNTGAEYRHVVDVQTISFEKAPPFLRFALDYVTQATKEIIMEAAGANFNEVLTVAYLRGGKMNFHDDGEKGLGPNVATLSLGSVAQMTFRQKAKQISGSKRKSRTLFALTLRHGDITIMEGSEVQKCFEHAVTPEPGLRFAATCRTINSGHLL